MLLAGDEFGRSQRGNNNAYCQDNELSWLDWKQAASPEGQALAGFVARLLALRHTHPVLRCRHFMHGKEQPVPGIADISWFDQQGGPVSVDAWNDPDQRVIVLRRAARDEEGAVPVLTLFLNPTGECLTFRLPPPYVRTRILIDTDKPGAPESDLVGETIEVAARSAVLIIGIHKVETP
jgi:isoamylase